MYTLTDLSCANWLLETQNQLNHRQIDINWAKDVKSFFALIDRIQKYVRNRALATKAVYDMAKRSGARTYRQLKRWIKKIQRRKARIQPVYTSPTEGKVRRANEHDYRMKTHDYRMKTRVSKSHLRIKCANIAERLQTNVR